MNPNKISGRMQPYQFAPSDQFILGISIFNSLVYNVTPVRSNNYRIVNHKKLL